MKIYLMIYCRMKKKIQFQKIKNKQKRIIGMKMKINNKFNFKKIKSKKK